MPQKATCLSLPSAGFLFINIGSGDRTLVPMLVKQTLPTKLSPQPPESNILKLSHKLISQEEGSESLTLGFLAAHSAFQSRSCQNHQHPPAVIPQKQAYLSISWLSKKPTKISFFNQVGNLEHSRDSLLHINYYFNWSMNIVLIESSRSGLHKE